MENQNQIHTLGQPEALVLGPIPCNGAVCINRSRYDELVRAEMEREILFHAYQTMDKYDIEHVLDAVFNSKFKFKPLDTANTAAGSEECAAGAE
jgi:hypothetical protein